MDIARLRSFKSAVDVKAIRWHGVVRFGQRVLSSAVFVCGPDGVQVLSPGEFVRDYVIVEPASASVGQTYRYRLPARATKVRQDD